MRILQHSAPFSHSLLPSEIPLLTAPIPPLQLAAPKVAGLLPASTPRKAEIIRKTTLTPDNIFAFMATFRTKEQLDAELSEMAEEALAFMARRPRRNQVPL